MKPSYPLFLALGLLLHGGCREKKTDYQRAIDQAKALPAIREVRGEDMLLPGEAAIAKECDEIMRLLQAEGVEAAFAKVRVLSPLSEQELAPLEKVSVEQLAAVKPRYGRIIGYERVRVVRKSPSVLECVYIAKCERHILRWRFHFYRPEEKWFLNTFTWDDNIKDL